MNTINHAHRDTRSVSCPNRRGSSNAPKCGLDKAEDEPLRCRMDGDSTESDNSLTKKPAWRWPAALGWLPPLVLVALFIVTGLRGIDFGYHWDERDWQLLAARNMVANGVLLSRPYTYPGFSKPLVMVPALRDALPLVWKGGTLREIQAAMLVSFDAPGYLLRARSVFVVVSSLGILWVYLAAWLLSRRWWQAMLAASLLGLSWELAYHSRWLVTDT